MPALSLVAGWTVRRATTLHPSCSATRAMRAQVRPLHCATMPRARTLHTLTACSAFRIVMGPRRAPQGLSGGMIATLYWGPIAPRFAATAGTAQTWFTSAGWTPRATWRGGSRDPSTSARASRCAPSTASSSMKKLRITSPPTGCRRCSPHSPPMTLVLGILPQAAGGGVPARSWCSSPSPCRPPPASRTSCRSPRRIRSLAGTSRVPTSGALRQSSSRRPRARYAQ
mmetsp:Transcript_100846/g.314375  ORF Transcript_100846/g.314375 Transcript_100846/m.314375 type:complete len:227 (+) Transcript_100846:308-988(+)